MSEHREPASILFVHSSDELYGSDRVLLELVRRLDRNRFTPLVAVPCDLPYRGHLSAALAETGVRCLQVDMGVLRRRYFGWRGVGLYAWRLGWGAIHVARLIRRERVALVHSNTGAVWAGALAARLTRTPHVWHIHEIVAQPVAVRRAIAWMATRLSDRVVAISQAVRDHLVADAPGHADRITVIPDAVDTDRFRPENDGAALRRAWGVGPDDLLVGQVGRISAWKGQEDFLAAAAQVAAQQAGVRFVVVGDVVPGEEGRLQRLQMQTAAQGLSDRVIWAGFRTDTPQVMAALDVLVLPSRQPEPFGMVLLEAMATGKPVIATDHGGPREIVIPGETGLLVPPGDPAALARAIMELACHATIRRQMGAAARARAERSFGLLPYVSAFEALYGDLLAAPSRQRPK
jgi:glycosyltransferase involved in cell wall biosynthesis